MYTTPYATRTAIPLHRHKTTIVAAFLALMLLVSAVSTATRVAAEPVGPGLDSFTVACRNLQDQGQQLRDEYAAIAYENPNDPRLDDLLAQIRNVGTTWRQIGCQAVFGNIVGLQVPPRSPITGVRAPIGGARLAAVP